MLPTRWRSRKNNAPEAVRGVGHRTSGQSDNLVDPAQSRQGRQDTMEGPADAINGARGAAEVLDPSRPVVDDATTPARPCRITFHGFPPSEPPRIEVRAWLSRLGALTAPMLGGEVAIEAVDEGRKERRYLVRMELLMPAGPVIVGADHPGNVPHEDVYVAIRNAFRAARRELGTNPPVQDPPAAT
jgi:hypothetical protein